MGAVRYGAATIPGGCTVPKDFLGLCYVEYPVAGKAPKGIISYGNLRMSQMIQGRWHVLETSPGIYDTEAFNKIDAIITYQKLQGNSIVFGIYGTPIFYTSSEDAVRKGPWNILGECANPTSLQALESLVSMLVTRYNTPQGTWYKTYGTTLGKGIDYWEPWNEPDIEFWWGTDEELVDVCYTQYATIKSIDPSIVVLSPGFANGPRGCTQFLPVRGRITGRYGKESCDGIAWHPYTCGSVGALLHDIIFGYNGVLELQKLAQDLPLYITEYGIGSDFLAPHIVEWFNGPAIYRYHWFMRLLMVIAGYGVKMFSVWHWKLVAAHWDTDVDGVQKAFNMFSAHVVGKTILTGHYNFNNEVTLIFTDGTSLTV